MENVYLNINYRFNSDDRLPESNITYNNQECFIYFYKNNKRLYFINLTKLYKAIHSSNEEDLFNICKIVLKRKGII